MDVSLYYDFECIVRYGSISEAAKHLHISQPALSRRVTSIEQEVGMELFERTTPIQLTMAGEIFLEYACRINAEQYKLSTHMNRLRTTPVTVLHVAGLYSKKIGRAVRSVKNQIETDTLFIDIKQETNLYREPSVDLLRKGKLQLSIEPFCPDLNMEGLDSTPLCEEDIYAVMSEDYAIAEKGFFDGSDLHHIRFTYSRSGRSHSFYTHLRWLCKANGLLSDTPRSIFISNAVTERDIFLSGLGDYAIMCPKSLAELLIETAGPGYTMFPFKGKCPRYDIRAIYAEKPSSETLEFVEALKKEFAND